MRILHIITDLNLGGAETMLHRLLRAFARQETSHEVVSLTDLGVVAERIHQLGITPRALGMSRVPNPTKVLRLAQLIAETRPDVVQTWMYHADLIGGIAAKLADRSKVVWGIHNNTLDPQKTHRTTRWTVAACARLSHRVPDCIVAVSRAARALHVAAGYSTQNFIWIPNGFDTNEFRPDAESRLETRRQLGADERDVLIGLIARVDPQKDHSNFIRAAGLLSKRQPHVRYVLCGAGATPENRELVRMMEQHRIVDRSMLLGARDDIARVANAIDIGTLSSKGEAFPLVIGEVMACGVPCVVTDVGDCAYLVHDTGRVVPPRAPEALARAWEELVVLGPEARRGIGLAARRRIEEHFGIREIAARYLETYRRVLGGAPTEDVAGSLAH